MQWVRPLKALLAANPTTEMCDCAVLAILGAGQNGSTGDILLIKRTMTVETHKGQISFPGGFRETHDAGLLNTALRETHEEIGIAPQQVEILGALSPLKTKGDVSILPFVGFISLWPEFSLNKAEVERILFLPFEPLIKQGFSIMTVDIEGIGVQSPGLYWKGDLIWGATARMLEELRRHLVTSLETR